jgi:alkylation response protein AidB-like acyl-CoA dehydrogenase
MSEVTVPEEGSPEQESPEAFGARAHAWVRRSLPPAQGQAGLEVDDEHEANIIAEARRLQKLIFDAGFAGIRYPREYGGQGLTRAHQLAWRRAAAGYQLPSAFNVTHGILGPTLLQFGTEEQKARHLPAMLSGQELWVQFLSEPSAGSDLAGLLTRAARDGDTFVLNGAKIWSTGAHFSDFAMVLTRTNPDVPKHAGLSMLYMPIRSPGVTVTPIKLVTGGSHFCQEFFDDVVLPESSLIGPEDDGWRIATGLLFHERNMVAGNSLNDHVEEARRGDGDADSGSEIVALARAAGHSQDPVTRQLVGEALVLQALENPTLSRINAELSAGRMPAQGAALVKLLSSLSQYRIKEIALEIGGTRAVMNGSDDPVGVYAQRWLAARIGTIAGGSNEMQRNAIGERALNLPREPSYDTTKPFREVVRDAASWTGAPPAG